MWSDAVTEPSIEEIALAALQVAESQGMRGPTVDPPLKGWRRGFTYGDIQGTAEWLAEIYLDIDLLSTSYGRIHGFRRIIVGAPLWIRTPRLRAIRVYKEYSTSELEGESNGTKQVDTAEPVNPALISRWLRKLHRGEPYRDHT